MMKLTIYGYQNKKENKYYKWYIEIIKNRLNNPAIGYIESHHILPRSLGGSDTCDNLVGLTAREHFIVHQLLPRFIVGQGRYKMIHAAACMFMKSKHTDERYINSNLYSYIKPHLSTIISKHFKELWSDPDYRAKIIKAQKSTWHNGSRDNQRIYMKNNSPLKNPEVHAKTMNTRELNGTNVWLTNNPMKNKERALEIASKRAGANHYSRRTSYFYSFDNVTWIKINIKTTLTDALSELGFKYVTYMKMLSIPGFSPTRGPMKGLFAKRDGCENTQNNTK